MVAYRVTKMITTSTQMVRNYLDVMIVVSSDEECLKRPFRYNCRKQFCANLSFGILAVLLILLILCEYTLASTVAGSDVLIVGKRDENRLLFL